MGSHRERQPLTLRPRVSPRLFAFVTITHALAAVTPVALGLGPVGWLLLIPVLLSVAHAVYGQVLMRAPWSIQSVCWQSDGGWTLGLASGEERQARLSPATFVTQWLVVLNFRVGRFGRRAVPLFADALDPDLMRRLRQRLTIDGCGADVVSEPGDASV